ncbi:MAG: hypothetical protein QM737_18275 [Ferruginibacter sp.]
MVDPLQSVVTTEDIYINRKLGIMFTKPRDWSFVNVKDFGKLKSEQIIGHGVDDSQEEIWETVGDPICVVTKYYNDLPEYRGIFSPTITLNITHKTELEDMELESFEELIETSELGTSKLLRDFKVIKRHDPYIISGCKFYEYDAEYLFEHIEIDTPLRVELKVLKAEHNNYYYDFNCHQSIAQNQTAEKEFKSFIKTIKLI